MEATTTAAPPSALLAHSDLPHICIAQVIYIRVCIAQVIYIRVCIDCLAMYISTYIQSLSISTSVFQYKNTNRNVNTMAYSTVRLMGRNAQ